MPDLVQAFHHFFGLVSDLIDGCWNADAGISFLDADAQPIELLYAVVRYWAR